MTIQELSYQSEVPVRTIRFYISERLLAGPDGRGIATEYTEEHLKRLLVIKELTLLHMPLVEIRNKLEKVRPEDLDDVLEEANVYPSPKTASESPKAYIGMLLAQAREKRAEDEAPVLRSSVAPLTLSPAASPSRGESWLRIKLAPGIELHVNAEAQTANGELIEELVDLAKSRSKKGSRRKS